MHEGFAAFAPARGVAQLNFADALDDRLPEISKHDERPLAHRALVQHFPDDRELDESACAAGTGDVTAAAPDELEEAVLPRLYANFFVHPAVCARFEKPRRDGERFTTRLLRTARDGFHHTAISTTANRHSLSGEGGSQRVGLRVVRVAFTRTRAAKDGDDL